MRPDNHDIRAVIEAALQKYEQGRERYGQIDLSTDGRDFTAEAIEELIDCINYCVFQILKLRSLQHDLKSCTQRALSGSNFNQNELGHIKG